MKVINSLGFICLLNIFSLGAQNNKESFEKDFDRAEKIFSKIYQDDKTESLTYSKGIYVAVLPLFLDLYNKDTTNMNVAFKLGVCFQNSRTERVQAIPYFNKAITAISSSYKGSSYEEKKAPFLTYKLLGDAYHLNYQFDKGIEAYEKFISIMVQNKDTDSVLLAEVNRKIGICKTAKRLTENPVKIKIENLGSEINSSYADYSPVLSADQNTIFFTSRRPETTGGKKDVEGNYMEDIYMSTKTNSGWSKASNIGSPINTDEHEATVGISPDGQTILIYKDDLGDGNIYSTTLEGDVWSSPIKLNENINSPYWEPSAFISADGNTLYFTSNRPGGYGGRDLYMSKRTMEEPIFDSHLIGGRAQNKRERTHGSDWGEAVNLGPTINTPFDEDAPFIHPDGVTLSFSSNGHNTMGGFDIFSSLLSEDGIWSEPMNIGFPINTTDDDIFYVVSPDGRNAYFSSFRDGGLGEKDNYLATFLDQKETPLTLVKGNVNDKNGNPAKNVEITVTDNETGKVVGVYHTNSKTGQFLFIMTPSKNYNITYQAKEHLFYSENIDIPRKSNYFELKRAVSLNPIVVGSKITLNNIFFDFDKASLKSLSNVELKNMILLLKSNPNLKVEIAGHTDSKGNDAYNLKLSEERAMAIVNILTENGIDPNRIKAKGYGKTIPIAFNEKANGLDDLEGMKLNRRVELNITEIN